MFTRFKNTIMLDNKTEKNQMKNAKMKKDTS